MSDEAHAHTSPREDRGEPHQPPAERRGLLNVFLGRPIGMIMSLILACGLGVIAYQKLPLRLLPDGFTPPFMWVQIPTLAASPEESEQLIAKPLEDTLATLAEIDRLRTFIRTNSVGFAVDLRPQSDPDVSYTRIRARLRRELPKLPEGAQYAFIWRHDPNEEPLYVFSITYPEGHPDPARVIQEELIKPLERLDGVSRVEVNGVRERMVRIEVDPRALKRARVSGQELLAKLRADHFTLTAGDLRQGERRLWVNASSRFDDLESLKARPITPHLKLGDVAEVRFAPDPSPVVHRVNGRKSCSVTIYKVSTKNTIEVAQRVSERVQRALSERPELKRFVFLEFFNQGTFIETSLNQIKSSAIYGGVIAVLCLWFFLRSLRLTLMITTAIPLCLLTTIALLYLRGQSLNVLSMMGIILSVGMVIDNAIVVLEQIVQRRREGLDPRSAALSGSRGVALAVTLATSTTLVVFLPLVMVSDQPMLTFFIKSIGEPVTYALCASLLIALVHLPTMSQYVRSASWEAEAQARREEPSSEPTLSGLERLYHRVLSWTLERRLVTSGFTLVFFLSVGYPAANLNRVDQGNGAFQTLSVNVLGPLNGPQAQLDSLAREVERRLLKETSGLDIKSIVCARGWSPEHLRISLYLTPPAERKLSAEERTDRIKAMLPERSGYRVIMRRGMGDKGDGVNISVYGSYLGMTTQLARELRERLKELPEVKDVQLELPESGLELKLRVDAAWAQIHELTPAWISTSINASLQERQLGEMITAEGMSKLLFAPRTEDLKLYEVGQSVAPMPQMRDALQALSTEQPSVEDRSLDGLVERQLELGSGKIRRKQRRVQVQLNVLGEDGEVMSALERFIPSYSLPIGYGVDYGDRFKNRRRNERGGALAVLMGIALVFCLMGVLFEGLLTPLAILGTIPLAFVGSIWTLWASGTSFEVMAMIGGVILVGVVVNNGIVLIDQIQHLRREGLSRDHAILKASVTRLRPILMTALTTIGGLIPMAFGGGETVGIDYQPLGQVVIGGLASSTLLTLLVIPLLYTLFDDLSEAPREVRARQRSMLKRLRLKRGSS